MSPGFARFRPWLLVLGVLLCAPWSLAQQPPTARSTPPRRPLTGGGAAGTPNQKYLIIPGFLALNIASVQKEIGLTAEQKQQLMQLSTRHQAALEAVQTTAEEARTLPPDEQKKRVAELRSQVLKLNQSVRKAAEAVVSPEQYQALDKISFRLWVAGAVTNPSVQGQLGLTEQQRQQLTSIYEKATERMQQLQRQTAGEALELLTPEQQAKLHQQMESQGQQ